MRNSARCVSKLDVRNLELSIARSLSWSVFVKKTRPKSPQALSSSGRHCTNALSQRCIERIPVTM
jgi:hypothetical protein